MENKNKKEIILYVKRYGSDTAMYANNDIKDKAKVSLAGTVYCPHGEEITVGLTLTAESVESLKALVFLRLGEQYSIVLQPTNKKLEDYEKIKIEADA